MAATDPVLVVVEPRGEGSLTVQALRTRYGSEYVLEAHTVTAEALAALRGHGEQGHDVALVLADRASGGADLLQEVRTLHPRARRALLLDPDDARIYREEIAVAFVQRRVECFVVRPLGTPDERFHRSTTELLDEWWRIRGPRATGVQIVGPEPSVRVHEMCDLLQRHDISFTFHPAGSEGATAVLAGTDAGIDVDARDPDVPVVRLVDGRVLVDPTNVELAGALGARTAPWPGTYDLVVVGGGPAGLSAAVYAGSEGLRTALVEPVAMGGQAGTSSMIRNYLGFPRGISGAELAARALEQAILFGTDLVYGSPAVALDVDGEVPMLHLEDGDEVPARSVIIATGVSYRRLDVPALEPFEGLGVYYGAAMTEAPAVAGADVFVVGGGNSAGQAAVHLAKFARQVTILIRGDSLASSMSSYLITEIEATDRIVVRRGAEVVGGGGDARLEEVQVRDRASGEVTTHPAAGLFVLIGAAPFTDWLPPQIERDEWGYVMTGPSEAHPGRKPFESAVPGVFAVGDCRRGSIKRVASASGEGAVCVRHVHDHLDPVTSA